MLLDAATTSATPDWLEPGQRIKEDKQQMRTRAAILVAPGHPLVVDDLEIPVLQSGQVLVEIHYSGVCHTQLLECKGDRGRDPYLPHCLGHEGSGVVCEVGPGVTKVATGDRVVLSWIKGDGLNVPGTQYGWGSRTVNAGAVTTFSHHAIVSENRLVPVPDEFPLDEAALFGCALPTGMGAVLNSAQASKDKGVVVFGNGGVGLAAIAAARLCGCSPIVGVDPVIERRELALAMGATEVLDPNACDISDECKKLFNGALDIAIEATGRPSVMRQALAVVRPRGGIAVVLGNARNGEVVTIDPRELNAGKQFRGSWGGDCHPDRDVPRFGRLLAAGSLSLKPLLATSFPLNQINDALGALESGKVGRPLIAMRHAA